MNLTELIAQSAFTEITALLVLAAIVGFIGLLLRQPLIVSFIAVGLLSGPSGLDIVHSKEQIELLSELGIAVLLFLVGIKLDVKLIRSIGGVSVMTGLGQVAFTSIIGYLIGLAIGLDTISSLYIAVALTFSSTIIIVKLLSDKREIDSLHGQIALGFLIVQDLVVVVAMIVLAAIGIGAGENHNASIWQVALSGLALLIFVIFFIRYIANPLTEKLAKASELLVIYAIAQAALFAAIGEIVGLGMEVGGLLAGVALASTPFRESIAARLGPLRDFLLLFFFIALGATIDLSLLGSHLTGAILFSVFVLIGNPLIVLIIMGLMGYRKRTGFLAGLTVAQISEFSLIFIAMGISLGHVQQDILGLVTLVGIVTIAASTYMITYSHQLYALFEPILGWFERQGAPREKPTEHHSGNTCPVIVFGLGRLGTAIASRLQAQNINVLGVDFNPAAIKRWNYLGLDTAYGDVTDAEFIADLPLRHAKWVVSTVPHHHTGINSEDTRRTIVQLTRTGGFKGQLATASQSRQESEELQLLGIDLILEPFQDAADRAVELLLEGLPEQPQREQNQGEKHGVIS
ncbi:cation:proton antiporter [Gilvimarinus agarilyticus]|uniref:cation:proton antiporter n=1 Tax=Gilvimarinus sp. 2_MG-2023 TaxID=3062666 RepID=UPI001C0A26E4|nr:cation:proton antiporter [Gilvimarinus sp. 2_MG-2023]MBU2884288.1 cation:proton antiporter [Gilvimarinus agarilyticus]MDO6569426.1 cation:proton antiporter [Gilvimarinus sp. 2_MG-2023]